jgi:hypothetical protein
LLNSSHVSDTCSVPTIRTDPANEDTAISETLVFGSSLKQLKAQDQFCGSSSWHKPDYTVTAIKFHRYEKKSPLDASFQKFTAHYKH